MRNYALEVRFNGSAYHGWQIQRNALTVEEVLCGALQRITGEPAGVTGCSRTDAGVHALSYVCNFRSGTGIPAEKLPYALNTVLPRDIRALRCAETDDDFHARFSAVSKTYVYKTYHNKFSDPFLKNLAYHFPYDINFDKMTAAAKHFIGEYDFSAFMASGNSHKTTVRRVTRLELSRGGEQTTLEISANAFLYNMVRIITGTLLYVGMGKIQPDEIPGIIADGDRRKSGITAPPDGLYLANVEYKYDIWRTLVEGL